MVNDHRGAVGRDPVIVIGFPVGPVVAGPAGHGRGHDCWGEEEEGTQKYGDRVEHDVGKSRNLEGERCLYAEAGSAYSTTLLGA